MAGLSTWFINNKLAAEGTTTKTRQLILDFLNTASSAAAIDGSEPMEGPVFDDPDEGYGDQYRDYDIGRTVAQRIINKRNSIGGFSNLNQLAYRLRDRYPHPVASPLFRAQMNRLVED